MAGSLSNFMELEILDHLLINASYTAPSTVYLALYTTDPTDADSGTEVTGGSYAREVFAVDVAAARATDNTSLVTFTTATANWGTVSHWGLHDAITAGNLMAHGDFTTAKAVNNGDTAKINAGDIDLSWNANGIGNFAANEMLDHVFRNNAFTSPTTVYMALYTANPTDADSGTEVTGGAYARIATTFGTAAAGATDNTALISFVTATANWGTVSHWAVRDAVTAGNLLFHTAATAAKAVNTDDTAEFPIGDANVTMD